MILLVKKKKKNVYYAGGQYSTAGKVFIVEKKEYHVLQREY